ncbi:MAG: hypothetical protein KatS3mg057_3085 [Herpetosiphonaceae bacterium]|nr:MAG: hypothetical protein KatS3mg057_3085 [Herpetosiphonaceae bacterium]
MNDDAHQAEQARRLAHLLIITDDNDVCRECLDALDEYIDTQIGSVNSSTFNELAQHMDRCVACSEAYALLYEARLAEVAPLEPEHIPEPDLSFLAPNTAGPLTPSQLRAQRRAARLREALAQAIVRAGSRLKLIFSRPLLDALSALDSAGRPALAMRSATGPDKPLIELQINEPGAVVELLDLAVYSNQRSQERCTLRVRVSLQGCDWPNLAGVSIRLLLAGGEYSMFSDPWGEAVFEDIFLEDLPALQLEIDAGPTDNSG